MSDWNDALTVRDSHVHVVFAVKVGARWETSTRAHVVFVAVKIEICCGRSVRRVMLWL